MPWLVVELSDESKKENGRMYQDIVWCCLCSDSQNLSKQISGTIVLL